MHKEYRLAKGWAIFIYIFTPPMMALFGYMLFAPLFSNDFSQEAYWLLAPVSVAMLGLFGVGLLDTIKGKIIIDNNSIHLKSTLTNRSLRFDQIKGYRVDANYIYVLPAEESLKQIKISTYTGKVEELTQWLSDTYPDVDQVNCQLEQQQILDNYNYGSTTEERNQKFQNAQKYAAILNWVGGLTAAWAFFLPKPYNYAITASLAIPILAIITLFPFRGLIHVDERTDSAHPSISLALLFPTCALILRVLFDFNIYDYTNIWEPAAFIAIALVVILLFNTKEFNFNKARDYFTISFLTILLFGYAYSAVVSLNCIFDDAPGQSFQAKVIEKRVDSGKSTTYYLNLTPWGPRKEVEEVSVSEEMFTRVGQGQAVRVEFKKGVFQIPWFDVKD